MDIFNNYWIIQSVTTDILKGISLKDICTWLALFWKISVLDTDDFCLLLQTEQCASFVYQGMITRSTITGFFVLGLTFGISGISSWVVKETEREEMRWQWGRDRHIRENSTDVCRLRWMSAIRAASTRFSAIYSRRSAPANLSVVKCSGRDELSPRAWT